MFPGARGSASRGASRHASAKLRPGREDASFFNDLADRNVPDFREARFAARAFHVEDDDVLAGIFVGVERELVRRIGAVAEIPVPTCDGALGLVLEGDQAALHVDDLETPPGLDGFAELRFEWHQ